MSDEFRVELDPLPKGTALVFRCGYFLEGMSGYGTEDFLLRTDGTLLQRSVHDSYRPDRDGRGETTWHASPWLVFHRFEPGTKQSQALVWLRALKYELGTASIVPNRSQHRRTHIRRHTWRQASDALTNVQ